MPDALEVLRTRVADAESELTAYRAAATDLDETRRLAYMALVAGRTSKHSLAGTLINALVHHNLKLDRDDTIEQVVAAIEGDNTEWLLATVDQLTEKLDAQ